MMLTTHHLVLRLRVCGSVLHFHLFKMPYLIKHRGFIFCHDVWEMDVELLHILNLGTGQNASYKHPWTPRERAAGTQWIGSGVDSRASVNTDEKKMCHTCQEFPVLYYQ